MPNFFLKLVPVLVLLAAFVTRFPVTAQKYSVQADVTGYPEKRAYLAALKGDEVRMIDSVSVIGGSVHFIMDSTATPGVYRLFFMHPSQPGMFDRDLPYVDFIFNNENIRLLTSFESPINNMVVKISEENGLYFRFLKLRSEYRQKLGLLLSLAETYRPGEEFFPFLYKELLAIQKAYDDSLLQMAGIHPEMLVSSLILLHREPVYDPVRYPDLDLFMQENYLKPVNINDPRLIYSPEITRKIISYLGFFRQNIPDQEAQELEFIRAVDAIMEEVRYDETLYDFVLNYLIDGFERFQMERVLVHIADNHLTGECKTESEEIARERLEAYQKMAPGNNVPDINLLNPFHEPKRLSELDKDFILLIFWSSDCPHCTSLLPRLGKWYQDERNSQVGIYAVSIDKSRADWEEFVLLNDLQWTNVHDPEGWESKTSRRYNLYATPTMFLLDKDMKIVSKPLTFREFRNEIEKHF